MSRLPAKLRFKNKEFLAKFFSSREKKWVYTPADLDAAVRKARGGWSFAKASRVYGVPVTTIKDHFHGRHKRSEKGHKPTLPDDVANQLKDFVSFMEDHNRPLTTKSFKVLSQLI